MAGEPLAPREAGAKRPARAGSEQDWGNQAIELRCNFAISEEAEQRVE